VNVFNHLRLSIAQDQDPQDWVETELATLQVLVWQLLPAGQSLSRGGIAARAQRSDPGEQRPLVVDRDRKINIVASFLAPKKKRFKKKKRRQS
jgi:hypothetical protein